MVLQDVLIGTGLGLVAGYFVFSPTGKRISMAGARRGARYMESKAKLFE